MRVSARIFLGIIVSLLFFVFIVKTPAFAQTDYINPNNSPDVPANLHTLTQNTTIEVLSSFLCQITGIDYVNQNRSCLGVDFKTGKIGYVPQDQSAFGAMGNLIAITFTPSVSTGDYVKYLSSSFGTANSAYAQYSGFDSLNPLTKVWIVFRDFAYVLFAVVFILIGLLIMLRVKIDPRTVMSIQNQIPKLIIGILLVTFSFAIAGFLIDLMWITIFVILSIFSNVQGLNLDIAKISPNLHGDPFNFLTHLFNANSALGFAEIAKSGGGSIKNIVQELIQTALGDGFTGWAIGGLLGGIVGIVAMLVIAIAILVGLFRLWFALLQSYIMILIDIALAPFWIIAGVLPGRSINFTAWLKDMCANLFAFPATIFIFLIGVTFMKLLSNPDSSNYFLPPLLGGMSDPKGLSGLIGLGIILLAPNVVNHMKSLFKAPKIDSSGPMQILGAGAGTIMGTGKEIGGTIVSSKEQIPRKGGGIDGGSPYEERGMTKSFLGRMFR